MTSTHSTLTALAAGALMLGAGGVASAQTPYNSYQSAPRVPSSCRNVENLANGYVSAECETTGGFRWSTIRADDCRGDLSNRDGVLVCSGATATVGPLYPHGSSGTATTSGQTGAGGVIGALLGAVFGDAYGASGQGFEDDWERGRRPLAERRADLEARIDIGVRDGSISYAEANRLRTDYDGLVQLEARYAADGRLTVQERADLRDRYQRLSQQVEDQRDDGYGQWRPLADERYAFDARVEAAVRARRISSTEGRRLQADFQTLMRRESDYARGGISRAEHDDLTRRYAELNSRIGVDGGQYGGDYGQDPRAAQIEARIEAGLRSGSLSWTEADRLRTELRELTRRWSDLEDRVRYLR